MKKIFNKKLLSTIAVLAVSGTVAVSTTALAACTNNGNGGGGDETPEIVGKTYYVSATGTAENDGSSIDNPTSITLLNSLDLAAGDTIYLLPGTYTWNASWRTHDKNGLGLIVGASGASKGNIKIINAAYDENSGYTGTEKKVTLDFSRMEFDGNNRGVQINGDYVYWYGIDICGAGDNGMYIGGSFNTVEYCDFYNNRDTGLQLGRAESAYNSINEWPSYNLIKNCTSHNNYDDETYGENADGFAAKLTVGYGNVFDGCIAYRNSDDGWDLYAKSDSGNIGCVIIYNCVAFENGYLEYTQEYNHSKLNYNQAFNEPNLNSFKTRDGDGNGFKLGGSVMEGDVKMYNCLAFQNRMHGVTDNSNPGYLKVEGVTSYDNSAAIDDNPSSPTFGQVISTDNSDGHGNIDVARQTYSYNTVKNVLSVKSPIAKSLDNDAYRGSVINSLLNYDGKTNVIKGAIDANTKISSAKKYTKQVAALSPSDVFKQVPVVLEDGAYTYNLSGCKDSDNALKDTVHYKYRNADGSINMGDILAVKDDFDFSQYLGSGVTAGSTLNKTSWKDYTHFADDNLLDGVNNDVYARLLKAKETLTINSDESAVYQDFEVPTMLTGCTVNWTTDSDLLTIGKKTELSISKSEYITVGVLRPANDETVNLTAKISYLNRSITKNFELTIKKDVPTIGGIYIRVPETDDLYQDGGKIIMDAYKLYGEPVLEVENGAYYNGTLLNESQYIKETMYEFAASTKAEFVPASGFMTNHPGVYRITHKITLADGSDSASITYQIFVASTGAEIDFASDSGANVSVYRDGYTIAGELTNVTGKLYTVASKSPITFDSAESLIGHENVETESFRATEISFNFANENSEGYHIYYVLTNVDGDKTSKVYHVEIGTVDISTQADFMKIAGGQQVSGEVVAHTIYLLKADLDFASTSWNAKTDKFMGVLNGQGHKISNVTVNGASGAKNVGLFSQVDGGTIMNIKFDKIVIDGKDEVTGLVARSYGGYFHNIQITNIRVIGAKQRVGGLIAQVYDGATPTEVSQVSIVNPLPTLTATGEIDTSANEGELYYISADGNRAAGIIGFIQGNNPIKNSIIVHVSDCYVESYIKSSGYSVSSIVGEYNENGQKTIADLNGWELNLTITHCVSAGILNSTGTGRIGGMLGYHNGAGALTIFGCLSLQTTYYKQALLTAAQKNQSATIGNFSTSAEVSITNCVSLMEEYNTDYDVSTYSEYALSLGKTLQDAGNSNWIDYTEIDVNTKWTLVFSSGTTLKKPYVALNFLGNWD